MLMSNLEDWKYLHVQRPNEKQAITSVFRTCIVVMQGKEVTPLLGHRLVTRGLTCRDPPGCRATQGLEFERREEKSQWQAATKTDAEGSNPAIGGKGTHTLAQVAE